MPNLDFARRKLHSGRIPLSAPKFTSVVDVVHYLGAVQSQEYLDARWTLGLRMRDATAADIDRAFDDGLILRTHIMRPTWHFVTPADIRWIMELTAPRVHAVSAYVYRQNGIDEALANTSQDVFIKSLQNNNFLTRAELAAALAEAGIVAAGQRLAYIVMRAELDGLICSGPRRGKQFTYALLDERAPQAKPLPRDQALAELTRRYFTSHGPASPHDFAAWSGLTVSDAREGLDSVKSDLVEEEIDGKTYWFAPSETIYSDPAPTAHLLPTFDEYAIVMRDGGLIYDSALDKSWEELPFFGLTVIDGIVVGNWRRTIGRKAVTFESAPYRPFTSAESEAFAHAAQRFGQFLGLPAVLA
jgi:hypothetical protein